MRRTLTIWQTPCGRAAPSRRTRRPEPSQTQNPKRRSATAQPCATDRSFAARNFAKMAFELRRSVHALSCPLHIGCRTAASHSGQSTASRLRGSRNDPDHDPEVPPARSADCRRVPAGGFDPRCDHGVDDRWRFASMEVAESSKQQRAALHGNGTAPHSPHDHDPLRPRFENALAFRRIREAKRPTADRMLPP